jgi:hypothetical protein
MTNQRRRRTEDERIAAHEEAIATLRAKKRTKRIKNALERGLVAPENRALYKKLQRETKDVGKAAKLCTAYNQPELAAALRKLQDKISSAVLELVEDTDAETDDA